MPVTELRRRATSPCPKTLKARLREIALPLVGARSTAKDRGDRRPGPGLEAYLRDSGEFGYTLEMDVVDPGARPGRGLPGQPQGAIASTSPAHWPCLLALGRHPVADGQRVQGGRLERADRVMNVRQKHAHSWVEAYVGKVRASRTETTRALDHPRPHTRRRPRRVGRPGRRRCRDFRPFTDMVRYIWVFYIVGYDRRPAESPPLRPDPADRRRRCVTGYATIWELAARAFVEALQLPDISSLHQRPGFPRLVPRALALAVLGSCWLWAGQAAVAAGGAGRPTSSAASAGHPLLPPAGPDARRLRA